MWIFTQVNKAVFLLAPAALAPEKVSLSSGWVFPPAVKEMFLSVFTTFYKKNNILVKKALL